MAIVDSDETQVVLERLVGALALPSAPAVRQLTEERDELVEAGRVVRICARQRPGQGALSRTVTDRASPSGPRSTSPSWRLPRARPTVALSTAAMLIQHR
jgi:hypothetical protein